MTWVEVAWGSFTMVAAWCGSWMLAKRTALSKRASDAHVSAVEHLLPGIARLRALVHESVVSELRPRDIGTAVYAFEENCMQHAIALPQELQSVRRNVRAAVGNYFGAASLTAVDARLRDEPLSERDPYWQDISASYLEYVMTQLQQSLVQPRPPTLIRFEFWRRDEDPRRTQTLQED